MKKTSHKLVSLSIDSYLPYILNRWGYLTHLLRLKNLIPWWPGGYDPGQIAMAPRLNPGWGTEIPQLSDVAKIRKDLRKFVKSFILFC